ncbi:unnamed protein product [Caenorhabditis auriculariae]|uniref:Uncharacterized protein n=1 Tax=Caenorhabditis auriculariae TaxID=2777116 RepID=A0A8S1H639_9PELO|nr:unnamed protein product [Caenorhabditis auriculariae]
MPSFFQLLNESMQSHCAMMFQVFNEGMGIKALLHQTILEQCGLMWKKEILGDDDDENEDKSREWAPHNEEIARKKREREMEILQNEEKASSQRLKSIAFLIQSDGWFFEDDDFNTDDF